MSARPVRTTRRTILRGFGGAAIGLPLLESLDREAFAQTGPRRFLVWFEHGGTISAASVSGKKIDGNGSGSGADGWSPKSLPGQPLALGPIHEPLQAFASDLVVLRGVDNMACIKQAPYRGGHGWGNITALTSAKADGSAPEGPSIDNVLAGRLAAKNRTPFPSVNLYVPAHNYGTPFFRGPRQSSRGEYNPVAAFDKLFAGVSAGGAAPDPAALRARALRKSVLDGVGDQLRLFSRRLAAKDKPVVDAHLEHIRGLERQLATISVGAACTKPTVDPTLAKGASVYGVAVETYAPVMVDILLAAMRCGLANVGTYELGDFYAKFLNPTYPAAYNIGHSLHHSARDVGKTGSDASRFPQWYDTMLKNRQWRMAQFARLLQGLKSTPEGAGTMLDGSLILHTSEFSRGESHAVADLPILLAGKAGGRLRAGRQINYNLRAAANPATLDYETRVSLHNLFTSILNIFGEPDTHFGSTGHAAVTGPAPDLV